MNFHIIFSCFGVFFYIFEYSTVHWILILLLFQFHLIRILVDDSVISNENNDSLHFCSWKWKCVEWFRQRMEAVWWKYKEYKPKEMEKKISVHQFGWYLYRTGNEEPKNDHTKKKLNALEWEMMIKQDTQREKKTHWILNRCYRRQTL